MLWNNLKLVNINPIYVVLIYTFLQKKNYLISINFLNLKNVLHNVVIF